MKLNEIEKAMLAGDLGEPKRWAMDHMLKVGGMFDASRLRRGDPGAHDGRPGIDRPGRPGIRRRACRPSGGGPAGRRADDHRPARRRPEPLPAARADRGNGGDRAPLHRRLRQARYPDDQHLHQLPDGAATGAQRARRLWRHGRRHLFQQRARGPLEFRGRAVGAGCRADGPHAPLRPPPRSRSAWQHAASSSARSRKA